jgi:hypothetical protein
MRRITQQRGLSCQGSLLRQALPARRGLPSSEHGLVNSIQLNLLPVRVNLRKDISLSEGEGIEGSRKQLAAGHGAICYRSAAAGGVSVSADRWLTGAESTTDPPM